MERARGRPGSVHARLRELASTRRPAEDLFAAPVARHNRRELMSAASVIGREDELGDIEAFLAEVEKGPRVLVLSGEAATHRDRDVS